VPAARITIDAMSDGAHKDSPACPNTSGDDRFGGADSVIDTREATERGNHLDRSLVEGIPVRGPDREISHADLVMYCRHDLVVVIRMDDAVESDPDAVRDMQWLSVDVVVEDQIGAPVFQDPRPTEPDRPRRLTDRTELEMLRGVCDGSIRIRRIDVGALENVGEVMGEHLHGSPHTMTSDEDEHIAVGATVGVGHGSRPQEATPDPHHRRPPLIPAEPYFARGPE
jgi:hypothetical protein